MVNKFSLRSDHDRLSIYWSRVLGGFLVGLLLIFAGQLYFLWLATSAWPERNTPLVRANPQTEDRLAVNRLLAELDSRSKRLSEVLATTTVLIDPSL